MIQHYFVYTTLFRKLLYSIFPKLLYAHANVKDYTTSHWYNTTRSFCALSKQHAWNCATVPIYSETVLCFKVNKMALVCDPNDESSFTLNLIDPNKTHLGIVCQAATPELQAHWVTTVDNILQKQKDFLKAIQSPIAYQKELTRDA